MAKKCPGCGRSISSDYNTCPYCWHCTAPQEKRKVKKKKISEAKTAQLQFQISSANATIIIGLILLIVGLFVAIYIIGIPFIIIGIIMISRASKSKNEAMEELERSEVITKVEHVQDDPLALLKKQYVLGKITKKQYEERREVIGK